MVRWMCVTGWLLCLFGLTVSPVLAQGLSPAGPGNPDSVAPPSQQPVPNNPNAAEQPLPPQQQQSTPGVPVEGMSSIACLAWGIVVLGVVALLIWLFGSRRRRELRGAPYADTSHNPGASGPYFQDSGPQPGVAGTGGFLGGLPGVYLFNRLIRRKPRDKEN